MACHVYDNTYCKVPTIACYDVPNNFLENLNALMQENDALNVNLKGFMAV